MVNNPEIFGILNVTPDSFSDGGLYESPDDALEHAAEMFDQGASYVDVGAESTRPGATPLTHEEEWARLEPVLPILVASYRDRISLDTYHPETVQRAVEVAGPLIVNDVTGFNNPEMISTVADLDLRCIVSHLPKQKGVNIQKAHTAKALIDSKWTVIHELEKSRDQLVAAGIDAARIILDPGIGFGKTKPLNWELLGIAHYLTDNEIMVGYSHKRFLGNDRMNERVNTHAGELALEQGAKYLRVHDVAAHFEMIQRLKAEAA